MRFQTLSKKQDRKFKFAYRERDRALVPVPDQPAFGYSLSFNEVQLELSETGLASHVWGYCPRESWKTTNLEPPNAALGELRVVPDHPLVPGAGIKASKTRLPVLYNERKQWLCFGDPSADSEFRIEFAPGLIVVGNTSLITSLWVRVDQFEP